MPIPSGNLVYDFSEGNCSASGVSWTSFELDRAISEVADSILYDDPARAVVDSLMSRLRNTKFRQSRTNRIFGRTMGLKSWRVGEAVGRQYLTVHSECLFPWPPEWDQSRPNASLAGPDLRGFHFDGSSTCFAFGEVKTSSDREQPPRVMRGSDGLIAQLRELRSSKDYRDDQVLYLARRPNRAGWFKQLESALERYFEDDRDVRLFGCLIRDVEPSESDLHGAVAKLASGHPPSIVIELLAIYLPKSRIPRLGHDLDEAMRRASP